jgi:hypothetical protein
MFFSRDAASAIENCALGERDSGFLQTTQHLLTEQCFSCVVASGSLFFGIALNVKLYPCFRTQDIVHADLERRRHIE